jgi:hypothetical protein
MYSTYEGQRDIKVILSSDCQRHTAADLFQTFKREGNHKNEYKYAPVRLKTEDLSMTIPMRLSLKSHAVIEEAFCC